MPISREKHPILYFIRKHRKIIGHILGHLLMLLFLIISILIAYEFMLISFILTAMSIPFFVFAINVYDGDWPKVPKDNRTYNLKSGDDDEDFN